MEQQSSASQTIIVASKQKSAAVAIILTLFFGPLGLLYSSVIGGIVMIFLGALVGLFTLGVGLLLVWPACIAWAVIAVNMTNKKQNNSLKR